MILLESELTQPYDGREEREREQRSLFAFVAFTREWSERAIGELVSERVSARLVTFQIDRALHTFMHSDMSA